MYDEILNQTESQLQFVAVAVVNEKTAYGVSCKFNGLFRIDLETEVCEFIQFFPNVEVCRSWLFYSAVRGEKGIYFSPTPGDYITRYDIKENKIHKIPLTGVDKLKMDSNYRFGDAFYGNGNVYFVVATSGCVLKYGEQTGNLTVLDPNIKDEVLFRRGMLVGDAYYIPSANSPIILEYRLQTDEVIAHKIGDVGGAWSIWGDGENFWMPPRDKEGAIRCWNKSKNKSAMIEIQVEGYQPQEMNFLKIFNSRESLIISPEYANMFLKVNMQTRKVEQLKIADINNAERYGYCFETSKYVYFTAYMNGQENINFKIEKETLNVSKVQFVFQNRDDFIRLAGEELRKKSYIMDENDTNDLKDFIALVQLLP